MKIEKHQQIIDYQRIEKAIHFIDAHFREQPTLDQIAKEVHLSPHHFQRLFTSWAGVSPKQFLQFISLEKAKKMLREGQESLMCTSQKIGLSGPSRLHDLFVVIEGMTPAEYKNGAKGIDINYHFSPTPFGEILTAATKKGLCYMAFSDDREEVLLDLKSRFSNAKFHSKNDAFQRASLQIYSKSNQKNKPIKLHLRGTDFQIKVWESLLRIPKGKLLSYGDIAKDINNPKACRAVGTAVGDNPVSYIIPCHRVIQNTGILGNYRWGKDRKKIIIAWELADLST